ncbi:uncharacterized protein LOC111241150 [Vigna radiata var. radiata]|uniref:Uncharacterized protein LOC111241150 n=1 Tax=Vigna radiata var. radiata TaxID=3916 RepID=A0A3Q0EPY3_VIGRR|nr:uncharacterized protein LOC111241150 [Vigna radiata var. radiata]
MRRPLLDDKFGRAKQNGDHAGRVKMDRGRLLGRELFCSQRNKCNAVMWYEDECWTEAEDDGLQLLDARGLLVLGRESCDGNRFLLPNHHLLSLEPYSGALEASFFLSRTVVVVLLEPRFEIAIKETLGWFRRSGRYKFELPLCSTADCRICVWNASDGSLVHSLTGHTEYEICLCWSHTESQDSANMTPVKL